jgi:hypothetical protein
MIRSTKKVLLFSVGFALIFAFQLPKTFASEVNGSLCTGLNCPVEGTVIVAPTATPAAGTYTSTQSIVLSASGATSIRYTLDGTSPTCSSTQYTGALSVTSSKTIKALSCYPNSVTSTVASFAYTLQCATQSVSNGSVGAYPTCAISCNSGYSVSGSSCVANNNGGGGGGGGGGNFGLTTTVTTIPTPTTAAETRSALITSLQTQLNALIAQLNVMLGRPTGTGIVNTPPATTGSSTFTQNLSTGSKGEEVRQLQQYLNAHGFTVATSGAGSSGNETATFGAATRAALARFQTVNGISPAVGYFGAVTRAYVNSH